MRSHASRVGVVDEYIPMDGIFSSWSGWDQHVSTKRQSTLYPLRLFYSLFHSCFSFQVTRIRKILASCDMKNISRYTIYMCLCHYTHAIVLLKCACVLVSVSAHI